MLLYSALSVREESLIAWLRDIAGIICRTIFFFLHRRKKEVEKEEIKKSKEQTVDGHERPAAWLDK